jgi:hypothetical protein
MDKAIRLKRGKMGIVAKQCDSRGRVRMIVDVPFPCEILNIMGRVAIGDEPRDGVFRDVMPQFFEDCQGGPETGPVSFVTLDGDLVTLGGDLVVM